MAALEHMYTNEDVEACAEAERLIDTAWTSEDPVASGSFLKQAYFLLRPLVEKRMPHALYLHACCTLSHEVKDEQEFDRRYFGLIKEAAEKGHAKAQFRLGQAYDRGGDLGEDPQQSAAWFRKSAEQGYAYAQWVHGLNLLKGEAVPRDDKLGIEYIQKAAAGKFEGALEFIANAYAEGQHGFPRDESRSQTWRAKLKEPGVIGY